MLRPLLFASCMSAPMLVGTAAWAQRSDRDVGDALAQPLRDLSILRRETPEVLQRAAVAPYADGPLQADGALDCTGVDSEIELLDLALGEDAPVATPSLMAQARSGAGNAIVDAIGDLVELPYRNVIRRLTGAERRDREMREAVQAGMVRRAFLRGLSARECATPHLLAAEPKPYVPPSDLELARMQLAAANEAARGSAPRVTPTAGVPNTAMAFAGEAPLSELERARVQLAEANASAAAALELWMPPGERAPEAAVTAPATETRISDLELARMQLAAANAAAAAASELWTPTSSPDRPPTAQRLSDLELARIQLAAANAAASER